MGWNRAERGTVNDQIPPHLEAFTTSTTVRPTHNMMWTTLQHVVVCARIYKHVKFMLVSSADMGIPDRTLHHILIGYMTITWKQTWSAVEKCV